MLIFVNGVGLSLDFSTIFENDVSSVLKDDFDFEVALERVLRESLVLAVIEIDVLSNIEKWLDQGTLWTFDYISHVRVVRVAFNWIW